MSSGRLKSLPNNFVYIFIALSAIAALGGYFLFVTLRARILDEKHTELSNLSSIKAEQIVNWRKSRLSDALIYSDNHSFIRTMLRYKANTLNNDELKNWFSPLIESQSYNNCKILDPQKKIIYSTDSNSNFQLDSINIPFFEKALSERKGCLSDFYLSKPDSAIVLDLYVPIYAYTPDSTLICTLIFSIDPYKELFPLIQFWPFTGKSSESQLIRKEQKNVVYLNDLRYLPGKAGKFMLPLSADRLPAAFAAEKKEGLVIGNDYRGIRVIGDVRKVTDSPWMLITKVDLNEIYKPIYDYAYQIGFVVFFLIFLTGGSVILANNKQQYRNLAQIYDSELKRAQLQAQNQDLNSRIKLHFDSTPMAFVITDSNFNIIDWNPAAEIVFEQIKEKVLNCEIHSVLGIDSLISSETPPYTNLIAKRENARVIANVKSDRKTLQICEFFTTPLFDFEDTFVGIMVMARDVTESKKMEETILNSREQLRALAVHLQNIREEERVAIARDLHDDLGQMLTSIKMNISLLIRELSANSEENSNTIVELKELSALIDQSVAGLRKMITKLRPEVLEKLGLIPAIEWQIEEFQKRTGIICEPFLMDPGVQLEPRIMTTVFRIFQEALTNVAKHSKATKVEISFAITNSGLNFVVADNGVGISSDRLNSHHSFGILGMNERVSLLGGELLITGKSGLGTTLELNLPIS